MVILTATVLSSTDVTLRNIWIILLSHPYYPYFQLRKLKLKKGPPSHYQLCQTCCRFDSPQAWAVNPHSMSLLRVLTAVTGKGFYAAQSWQAGCFPDALSRVPQPGPAETGGVYLEETYTNTKHHLFLIIIIFSITVYIQCYIQQNPTAQCGEGAGRLQRRLGFLRSAVVPVGPREKLASWCHNSDSIRSEANDGNE